MCKVKYGPKCNNTFKAKSVILNIKMMTSAHSCILILSHTYLIPNADLDI